MIGTRQKLLMGAARPPAPPEPMVLVFDTNLASGTTVTVPLGGTVDVTVDWGDGTSDAYTTTGNKTHTYAVNGEYTVEINGTLTEFGANVVRLNFTKCLSFGTLGLISLANAFSRSANFTVVPDFLPSTVTNLSTIFNGSSSFNYDISEWDVSKVTNLRRAFLGTPFNQNIGGWDVSKVTDMLELFAFNSSFNQNIGGWDMGAVTSATNMFRNAASFNQDLSGIVTGLTSQPTDFSLNANATFADNANGLKPFLADGVTQINT